MLNADKETTYQLYHYHTHNSQGWSNINSEFHSSNIDKSFVCIMDKTEDFNSSARGTLLQHDPLRMKPLTTKIRQSSDYIEK